MEGGEEEKYEKPFFLQEAGLPEPPPHPMESHPDWPEVPDPEIENFEYEDSDDEDNKPLNLTPEEMKFDPSQDDITEISPWLRKYMDPVTMNGIKMSEKIRNEKCYIDDDPRNLWLYKEYHGPVIQTVVRVEWGALPWTPKKPLNVPVKHVRLTYTGGPTEDYPNAMGLMQDMQKKHRAAGLDDIAYNYVISRDGAIFEGRGWYVDAHRPAQFNHLEGDCLDIAYLGDFSQAQPSWTLLKSAMDVIRYALLTKVLDPSFKVIQYNIADPIRNLN